MEALGMIETYGMVPVIEASDAAVKAANVEILRLEKVRSGIMTVFITGDVSAVKSSVNAGAAAASRIGTVLSTNVIARMADGLETIILKKQDIKDEKKAIPEEENKEVSEESKEVIEVENKNKKSNNGKKKFKKQELENMKVNNLRSLARTFDDFPIDKEKIKYGKKQELIELLLNYFKNEVCIDD